MPEDKEDLELDADQADEVIGGGDRQVGQVGQNPGQQPGQPLPPPPVP